MNVKNFKQRMVLIWNNSLKSLSQCTLLPKRYYCSVCGKYSVFFGDYGRKSDAFKKYKIIGGGFRRKVLCLNCMANDRNRWVDYIIKNETDLYCSNKRVLHIAPEKCIEMKFRSNENYISGDITPGYADEVVDITNIEFPDKSFDAVIINHVLEHIQDENMALHEINRILDNGGLFVFSMPICPDIETYELNRDLTPVERLKEYGQEDHFRIYGKDVVERVQKYGFRVKEFKVSNVLPVEQIRYFRLIEQDMVFIGEKE